MPHEFVIEKDGQILTFDDFDKIPEQFDILIKFCPALPPCDHSDPHNHDHKHKIMEQWHSKFKQLMERTNASSSFIG
jgi:hypothetical protein